MSDAFNMGAMLEQAAKLGASDTPDPLPPGGDEANQQVATPEPERDSAGDTEGADPGAGDEPVNQTPQEITEPPEVQDEPATVQAVRTWGRGLEKDFKAIKPVAEKVESLGGLDLIEQVATPILSAEFVAEGVLDAIEETRGRDAYTDLAWVVYDRHGDQFAAKKLPELLDDPTRIADPDLRARLERFREFEAGTATQPTRTATQTSPDDLTREIEDSDLSAEAAARVKAAIAAESRVAALEAQVQQLLGYKETETQRREREVQESSQAREEQVRSEFAAQFEEPIDRLVSQVKLSTDTDPQKAATENAAIQKRIQYAVQQTAAADPSLRETYQNAFNAHLRGDRVAVAPLVRQIKERFDQITKEEIRLASGRRLANIENDLAVREQPKRAHLTTNGAAVPPIAPPEPKRRAFDYGAMEQKAANL